MIPGAVLPWSLYFIGVVGSLLSSSLGRFLFFFELAVLSTYALAARYGALTRKEAGLRLLADAAPAAWMLLAALYWARTLVPGAPFAPGGSLAAALPPPEATLGGLRTLLGLLIVGVGVQALRAPTSGLVCSQPEEPAGHLPAGVRTTLIGIGLWGLGRVSGQFFGRETMARMGSLRLALGLAAFAAAVACLRWALDLLRRRG